MAIQSRLIIDRKLLPLHTSLMEQPITGITALISQIHTKTANYLKNQLTQKGFPDLVSSHGYILFQLSQAEKLTMSQLTNLIHRDKSTVTALVKKLETAGYIERTQNPDDNRVTYIRLSERGAQYTKYTSEISAILNETCCKGLTQEEQQMVFNLLQKIANNFTPTNE